MQPEGHIRPETVTAIRTYVLSRKEIDRKNIFYGTEEYSLREILGQVERGTEVGVKYAQMWERHHATVAQISKRHV